MKRWQYSCWIVPILLSLFSCGNEKKGSYDPNRTFKETAPVSLKSIGLTTDLEEDGPWKQPYALNGESTLNPKEEFSENHKDWNWESYTGHYSSLFSEKVYQKNELIVYYADLCQPSDGIYPSFYPFSITSEYKKEKEFRLPILDAVYANGCWSYVANFLYTCSRLEEGPLPFANGLSILYALTHCTMEDYPYTVYMDSQCLYFMNKSTDFPNDYIEAFNKREDMHLIYR